jgi:hypothetical protein
VPLIIASHVVLGVRLAARTAARPPGASPAAAGRRTR